MSRPGLRRRLILAAAAHLLVWVRSGAAIPSDQPVRSVTLQEAVASADRAPEMIAAHAGEQAAEAAVHLAGAFPDPEVSFTTNSVTAQESLSVLLPLPWPARGPRIEAARANFQTAGRTRDAVHASARRALRVAWFALAGAEERTRAVADRETRARRNADAIAALYAAGRVARLEEVRGEAEAALAHADRVSAEEALRTAGATLATLMGLEPAAAIVTDGARPLPGPEGALEAAVARARELSPEVRLQIATAEAAAARWRLARRLRIPSPGLNVGADWNDPTQPGTNQFVGVSVAIPISGPAAASVALGERDQQVAFLERDRRSAALAAETAWSASHAARLRFEAIDSEVLPAAKQTADLTRFAYQEGKVDLFRLLDAERLLSEAEVARADAYEAWGVAHAELMKATAQEEP